MSARIQVSFAPLAQLVEQLPLKETVGGSNPSRGTKFIMFKIYILLSLKSPKTYVGYTNNLKQRMCYHNNGKVKATKSFRPWKLIYTETISSISEAKQREKYLKSSAGRRNIKRIIVGSRPSFRNKNLDEAPAPKERGSLQLERRPD